MLLCYIKGYAQDSVDRSGQSAVDNPAVAASRHGRETPPGCRLAGATVAVLNTYKKKFFKNLQT